MNKMAIVPWGNNYCRDQIFNLKNSRDINRDDSLKIFVSLKEYLKTENWEVHTIDMYPNIIDIDLIVFFVFDIRWYKTVLKNHLEDKTVYIAFEPPVIDRNHSPEGIKKLQQYFKYILTWNDALVDNIRVFKFMFPYYFDVKRSEIPFKERKLLVNISGNKQSKEKNELYSEREKVISYFDNNKEFELYGTKWNKDEHPSYMGLAERKRDVYHRFKFALCLENMNKIDGYITEKIHDCLCAGIVPIYLGAQNIGRFIPSDCYIDYSIFSNLVELEQYLQSINEEIYENYIIAADNFLQSDKINIFTPENLGALLIRLSQLRNFEFFSKGKIRSYELNQYINKFRRLVTERIFKK